MARIDFDGDFRALTGHDPFPWQRRLFDRFVSDRPDNIPAVCDLPTGLGKTAVIPIWLLALAASPQRVPRRLVYVVNRRTVVDQSTREAESVRGNLAKAEAVDAALRGLCGVPVSPCDPPLAISTLRGQFADNREWAADPARPAVVVGTVDLVGSRLLFSGYRSGFKLRPLDAGFLGQDALLVHDEAHLEPAFQQLLDAVVGEQGRCRDRDARSLRVLQLSATPRGADDVFRLTPEEADPPPVIPNPPTEPIHHVWRRLRAVKKVGLMSAKRSEVTKKVAEAALRHKGANAAVLVYVRGVDDVAEVRRVLTDNKGGVPADQVEVLTGTLRGLERDARASSNAVFARFLPPPRAAARPRVEPKAGPVFLVCTSAGEVGVDISADHLVCDLSSLDSMAQRLGRVNRRGEGAAEVDVVYETDPDPKPKNNLLEGARWAALGWLRRLPLCDGSADRHDASPLAVSTLIRNLSRDERLAAFAPTPVVLPVTDVLFDAWALTTVRGKLPGRPPVADYLHGVRPWEPPETHVGWREEVGRVTGDLLAVHPPADLLDDFPLKPHELLRDTSKRVAEAFGQMAERGPTLPAWLVDDDGQVEVVTVGDLADEGAIARKTVLLPPEAGGLKVGLLDGGAASDASVEYDVSCCQTDAAGNRLRDRRWDDDGPPAGMRRVRIIDTRPDADDQPDQTDDEGRVQRRFWRWFERPAGDGNWSRSAAGPVTLTVHTGDVVRNATAIAAKLGLPEDVRRAIAFAAEWHDLGKDRPLFQRILGNPNPAEPWAKSGGKGKKGPRLAETYRHEFGSLVDVSADGQLSGMSEVADLALHLIACHHGYARPHFPAEYVFDPCPRGQDLGAIAAEVMRRFGRLQRTYGRWGLAYLESVLRAADYAASKEPSGHVGGVE